MTARSIDVLEVGDVRAVAGGLVGIAEIDRCRPRRITSVLVPVPPSIEVSVAVIGDGVVAAAGADDVGAAAAVDRIIAGAGGDRDCRRQSR